MGAHIRYGAPMKTTIDIADDLFERVQRLAAEERTTFRALTEEGLRRVLEAKAEARATTLAPLVSFGRGGLTPEFEGATWERLREAIYPDPPA